MHTKPEKKDLTRYEQLKKDGAKDSDIELPKVTLINLVKLLFDDISPATQTGNGLIPLSWQEIQSFIETTGIELTVFELKVIRSASKAYANQSILSTDPKCPPPHRIIKRDPMKLMQHIKSVFS